MKRYIVLFALLLIGCFAADSVSAQTPEPATLTPSTPATKKALEIDRLKSLIEVNEKGIAKKKTTINNELAAGTISQAQYDRYMIKLKNAEIEINGFRKRLAELKKE